MSRLMLRAVRGAATLSAIIALGVSPGAQTKGSVARTPDGKPDLQGNWSFATLTPLERPADLAGKPTFTQEEAEEYARRAG